MIRRIIKYTSAGIGVVIFILVLTVIYQYKEIQYASIFSTVDAKVQLGLSKLGVFITDRKVKKEGIFPPKKVAEIKIKIPLDRNLDKFEEKIKEEFKPPGVNIIKFNRINLKDTYQIEVEIGAKKILTHRLLFFLKKARVAILIDDFGYINDDNLVTSFFKDLKFPFTISIIPGTPFAKKIAEEAHSSGKQILVHLPMQPEGKFINRYKWIVLNGMSEDKIKETVKEAIKDIPYAEGLNNHMGSLVTSREGLIKPVLEVLKEKGMFFVDSRTSSSSVAYSLAEKIGLRSTFNCVFLDNKKEKNYIENHFNKLISIALQRGWALGLGHANLITASTLMSLVNTCDRRKLEFVTVSQILDLGRIK